ncbi:mycofactocin-coupled SDR family oxidoreductase [Rhodococcus sp. T7]|uniref:mycofactocin-coupled SDR family oxidoreductase n=1 Tax=Rhodococcus sp. T7 TaxID=627444 RepID=UPI001358F61A|nr:mycofactocin-coupled SDR family oxidoreductase [Rhodococcus sp. T7]KAF0963744.1 putative short-chain type dehydrogenase/reductase [Rhodococcus sp. T7]
MPRLAGKVAFVTGAARGQGRAEALRLAQDGADIIAVDVVAPVETNVAPPSTPADLEETDRGVKALGRNVVTAQVDVRDYNALKRALDEGVRQLGRLDIVVANAGIWSYGLSEEVTDLEWQVTQDVVLKGVWHTAKAAIPILKRQGTGGSLIFTSSTMAIKGMQNLSPYVAAKHGVVGLMKSQALELAPFGIRVNCVAPTSVNTKLIHNAPTYALFAPDIPESERTPDSVADRFATIPVMDVPWVEPEDIANAVAFLASDEARYVTGLELKVDAGQTLK